MSEQKKYDDTPLVCDGCGHEFDTQKFIDCHGAIWIGDGYQHFCPDCKHDIECGAWE